MLVPLEPIHQDSVLPWLSAAVPTATAGIRDNAGALPVRTLIYADKDEYSTLLAAGIRTLGRHPIIVKTPLDAITCLDDETKTIDSAFVSLQDRAFDIVAFFEFLELTHPRVRRIAFARHEFGAGQASVDACAHDMILWDPWDQRDFSEILKDALDCRDRLSESTWTDTALFSSRRGADRVAIGEILRRYRHRIISLVLDVTDEQVDAEDLIQEIYLAVMVHLPEFDGTCSAGQWIDRIAVQTLRSHFLDELYRYSARPRVRPQRNKRAEISIRGDRWVAAAQLHLLCELCASSSSLFTDPHCEDSVICIKCLRVGLETYSVEDLGTG